MSHTMIVLPREVKAVFEERWKQQGIDPQILAEDELGVEYATLKRWLEGSLAVHQSLLDQLLVVSGLSLDQVFTVLPGAYKKPFIMAKSLPLMHETLLGKSLGDFAAKYEAFITRVIENLVMPQVPVSGNYTFIRASRYLQHHYLLVSATLPESGDVRVSVTLGSWARVVIGTLECREHIIVWKPFFQTQAGNIQIMKRSTQQQVQLAVWIAGVPCDVMLTSENTDIEISGHNVVTEEQRQQENGVLTLFRRPHATDFAGTEA